MGGGRFDAVGGVAALDNPHSQTRRLMIAFTISELGAMGAFDGGLAIVAGYVDRLGFVVDVQGIETILLSAEMRRDTHHISSVMGSVADDVQHEVLFLAPQSGGNRRSLLADQFELFVGEKLYGHVTVRPKTRCRQPATGERVLFPGCSSLLHAHKLGASLLSEHLHGQILGSGAASVGCNCVLAGRFQYRPVSGVLQHILAVVQGLFGVV